MSDNDLIRRGALVEYIKTYQCAKCSDIGLCGHCAVLIALKLIEDAPAVPHEITARELFSARDRMCNSNYDGRHMTPACKTCPLWRDNNGYDMYCGTLMIMRPLDFLAIVEKWAQEHPEERNEE